MTDISKCTGKGCDTKDKCWRYLALGNPVWQSYLEVPAHETGKNCQYFWEAVVNKRKRGRKKI